YPHPQCFSLRSATALASQARSWPPTPGLAFLHASQLRGCRFRRIATKKATSTIGVRRLCDPRRDDEPWCRVVPAPEEERSPSRGLTPTAGPAARRSYQCTPFIRCANATASVEGALSLASSPLPFAACES